MEYHWIKRLPPHLIAQWLDIMHASETTSQIYKSLLPH
uniref:Uncharacterized protein n=1 Tax=Anguilla anguilla TaxID=7936 RepID=A0A0E9RMR6_ANGAN